MNQYIVKVRFFGEERDIREFIQPNTSIVQELAGELPKDVDGSIYATWAWVERHIRYPVSDYRYQEAFTHVSGGPRVFNSHVALLRETVHDFWQFPSETVAEGYGDCEDTTALGVSLLRHRLPADEVFATLGFWGNVGHGWVTVMRNGEPFVVETTRPASWPLKREGGPYVPFIRFNDKHFEEIRKGLLEGEGSRREVCLAELIRRR